MQHEEERSSSQPEPSGSGTAAVGINPATIVAVAMTEDQDVEWARPLLSVDVSMPEVPGYRLNKKLGEGTSARGSRRMRRPAFAWPSSSSRTAPAAMAAAPGSQTARPAQRRPRHRALRTSTGRHPPYYVMRYAEGGSLASSWKRARCPWRRPWAFSAGGRGAGLRPRQGNPSLRPQAGQRAAGRPRPPSAGRLRPGPPVQRRLAGPGHLLLHGAGTGRPGTQIPDTRWDVYGLGALSTPCSPANHPARIRPCGSSWTRPWKRPAS